MEGLLNQRVTPLLKCVVLFLFIFTAKVLTSRPHESQDGKNGIHHKPTHFVRTFTKYHHRRTIQWNQDYWPSDDHPKVIQKRNAEEFPNDLENDENLERIRVKRNIDQNSNEYINSNGNYPLGLSESLGFNSFDKTAISGNDRAKNGLSNDVKTYKVKAAYIPTDRPTTIGPTITCLYKTNSVAISATPSYEDDKNAQLVVENESFDTGPISKTTLPSGETVQIEQCTDPRAYCYTLWHQDSGGNITVLGQGCWRGGGTGSGAAGCGRCVRVTPRLPATNFCCCVKSYCNQDYASVEVESVTMKAEATRSPTEGPGWGGAALSAALALLAALLAAAALLRLYCPPAASAQDLEKADVMGSGPDALATGLLCVDNLTLIEHIGQGKFGSVWRGSLGATPVAVKLYCNAHTWQKEAAVYALPHLSHPNILRYYGSDSRATLDGGREHLLVLELCEETLRSRLERAPLSWTEFAHLAHGLASALAHLHTQTGSKPCVVHRDVNSNNVLVSAGSARLADLGLAQTLPPRAQPPHASRIAEAGTLRYLAPEALEGALDLSEARAALCAVDVFALGLVLWELLWRTRGAHAVPPDYCAPYAHHGLPARPTLAQMQSLVSRNKARPPLPKGPVAESRALKIAADTCDECWDHDAEARLTAVCVEERMSELKQLLQPRPPRVHHNIHHHNTDPNTSPPETDKNSNCTTQACDVTTPLLYPQPHIGRNACIERNTHTTNTHTVELIHKSLKDISAPQDAPRVQNIEENCLSVARTNHIRPQTHDYENSDRLNEIRSYQRPLDYVQNDVSSHDERRPKQTNLLQDVKIEKPKWGIRRFFEKKLGKSKLETEVKLVGDSSNNGTSQNGRTMTSIVNGKNNDRPSNLVLDQERNFNFEVPCTLSPPNRTLSPTMLMESDMNRENRVFGFKELPSRDEEKQPNQIFAVIVPKAKPTDYTNLIEMRNKRGSSESVKNSVRTSMSSQSIFKSGHSESEDSTIKKRLSCDNRIIDGSGRSSRASINLELQYMDNNQENFTNDSPFDLNSDCSSSEDEHLMLLSENGGSKITMQTIPKQEPDKKKYHNEVLKETSHKTELGFNFQNKYKSFDNEFSDPNDKENLVNGYSGDNPVYIAALNGEINTTDLKYIQPEAEKSPKSPKPCLKNLAIKRQHSLEQVGEIFSSSGDISLQNPAGRVKTPGDLPVAIRRARRDRALQKGRANECNRLSLYDDRMMFGNSL